MFFNSFQTWMDDLEPQGMLRGIVENILHEW
jgi:hypothetical protein